MEKKIFIGSTKPDTYDRRPLPITLEINLSEKSGMEHFKTTSLTPITPPALVLSVSGNIGTQTGGQIDGELKRLIDENAIDYRPRWDAERLTALLRIWERWHLNDMKAGCIHQSTAELKKFPCPQCGYVYGSAWLFDALPPEVTDFIKALDSSTPEDLEEADAGNVKGFVRNHKIRIDVKRVPENKNAPDIKNARHYKTTLYYKNHRMTTYFSQGTAIKEEPTAADVLNSLAQDAQTIEDYPDPLEWAGNLGYEAGTKAAKIFKATLRNTEALKKFLNEEYKALLEAEEL